MGKYLTKCMNQTTLSGISKTNLGLALSTHKLLVEIKLLIQFVV